MAFPSQQQMTTDPHFLKPFDPVQFKNARFLFRVDHNIGTDGSRAIILVQSHVEPNWDYAFQNARIFLAANPEYRSMNFSFRSGENYRFRVLANPTMKKSVRSSGKKNGPRLGLIRREDQIGWLERKANQHGFVLVNESVTIESQGFSEGWKGSDSIKYFSARFDGVLRVTDADKFAIAVREGIGSAKGFGFGLLSVAPA